LLSREYGFTPGQITRLTFKQLEAYMKRVRPVDKHDLEFEPVKGAKETIEKFRKAYLDKGLKVPGE